ncbi:MAG: Rpn family recombination-promoting nuclease/putative transposase [SAR324 cluster bacterium]|nr:Rpn family recombination-promoting nuclease/putative transposase [SAR324 cluster bacterium]
MKHHIDPTTDCVFKALLGNPRHRDILIHFLNSITHPVVPITDVDILNPYNEKEFVSDKLTVVDVKARDNHDQTYQVEIQLRLTPSLPSRILYTWSDLYQSQLESGENFDQLHPVISIWLLTSVLLPQSPAFHHHFEVWDPAQQVRLLDHCSIHLLELPKWNKPEHSPLRNEELWFYFFENAKHWDDLPTELQTIPEMRKAMSVLKMFSEKEKNYHLYQSRQNLIREERERERLFEQRERLFEQKERSLEQKERSLEQRERSLEQTALRLQQELQEKERLFQSMKESDQEKERLLQLLKQAGIEPEHS